MQRFFPWRRIALTLGGGLLAVQAAVIGVLAAIAEYRKRRRGPARFPHETRQISTVDGNDLCVYTFGEELYNAMLEAIDGARHTIYFETFIWKGDAIGRDFKARLIRKAAAGVDVYVVFDSFANLVVPRSFKHFPPVVNALQYRPLTVLRNLLDPRHYARDHRKLLVVDNEVAFIGGFNIGQLYATEWRDTHMRIRGPAAAELAYAFVDFWNRNCGRRPALKQPAERPWPQSITVHRNDPERLVFPIRGMILDAIERAQHHIYLTYAYFIPDRAILDVLLAAAGRGVDVRVLLPWQSNHVTADWLGRGYFEECLRGGVRIFAYQNAMIHAKTVTIDGVWSTVGTANLDRLSLAGNYEVNVEIHDQVFARELERTFMTDLTNAVEITLEWWEQRPVLSRAGELILSPLWPLL